MAKEDEQIDRMRKCLPLNRNLNFDNIRIFRISKINIQITTANQVIRPWQYFNGDALKKNHLF